MVTRLEATQVSAACAELGEGPLWDDELAVVWWVDITGRKILRTDPATGETTAEALNSMPGAIFFDDDHQLLVARPGGIHRGDDVLVAFEPADDRVRSNDGKVAPDGRIVVGTMGFDAEPGIGDLFRVDLAAASCERLLSGLTISNGLAWSEDGASMFHVDSPTQRVMRFGYPELGDGEVVVEIDPAVGTPDGMTIDSEGYLWVALWGGSAVHRYTPDGSLDTIVEVPGVNVTCCTFGGQDLDRLFITTAADGQTDGALFMCSVGVSGQAV